MQGSAAINVAVCGDPIICRALVLLLRGPDYDVQFVPTSSLLQPRSLEGVHVMLLALGSNTERRKIPLASLEEVTDEAKFPILELAASEERRQIGGAPSRVERSVPWPCSTKELKRRIRAALSKSSDVPGPTSEMAWREGV